MEFNMHIPKNVMSVCEKLEANGYKAYVVGGCVRDAILGKTPNDYDIATSAMPAEVESIFGKKEESFIIDMEGATSHGVTFVMYNNEQIEIATLRKDGDYEDGRHCSVEIGGISIEEDLSRRDFTINAMAYRPTTKELIDSFNGQEDCKNGVIRAVGNAFDRFSEDALRIMRAFRFQSQLAFSLDDEIMSAAKELHSNITNASYERISKEFTKLICGQGFKEALLGLYETGIMDIIMPEFRTMMECEQVNPHHCFTVGMHTLAVMEKVKAIDYMRYAALFHDIAKPIVIVRGDDGYDHFPKHPIEGQFIAEKILKRFHFCNEFVEKVMVLVNHHDSSFETKKSIRSFISKYGEELLFDELELRRADVLGQNPEYMFEEKLSKINEALSLVKEVIATSDRITIKDLAIQGRDLLEMGYKPGPAMGEILRKLFDIILEDPTKNTKEELMKYI